ncbi:MAG: hypothetical protein DLM72_12430 [Candidatus Nitrosopolaris wilkensis]|nr:MAG: hypothetical protein DLM72_12430 [Candidatus Nitrosopolaris wilkensis]
MILCKPQRQSTKSIASTSSLYNKVDGNQNLPARRERIRERFGGELSKIDKSDSSDILQSMARLQDFPLRKLLGLGVGQEGSVSTMIIAAASPPTMTKHQNWKDQLKH